MGVSQALADDTGVIGDRDFGIGDIRMPEFFPLEAIEALVPNRTQRFDLALDGDISASGQHIVAIFAAARRIFQVSMADPGTELLDREFRIFVRGGEGVMCIPEQAHVFGIG